MKDYRLSEIKAMCKKAKGRCSKCKIEDWCYSNIKLFPMDWKIDKEQQPKQEVNNEKND